MIDIPKQLQQKGIRFVRIKKQTKGKIVDKDWTNTGNYEYNSPTLISWLEDGENYGVCGGFNNLIIIDSDTEELTAWIEENLPNTFTILSGSHAPYKKHFYYRNENTTSCVLGALKDE